MFEIAEVDYIRPAAQQHAVCYSGRRTFLSVGHIYTADLDTLLCIFASI